MIFVSVLSANAPLNRVSKHELLVAALVGEGKLEWEVPIRQYYPEFELQDPVASSHTTLIDLMSHRTVSTDTR